MRHMWKLGLGLGLGRQTFRGHSSADFNIRLLNHHATLNGLSACASVLGRQHPFAIRLGESLDGDHADSGLIVAAVSWTETDTPASLYIYVYTLVSNST